jgi:hypothetical protein
MTMKVHINYTVDVPDDYRRALRRYHGGQGLATREEVKEFYRQQGETNGEITLQDELVSMDIEVDEED